MKINSITLPSGHLMPALGFGTWQATDEDSLKKALHAALEAGYRHIDTAPVYHNEKIIGQVLKTWLDSGKIKRSELFIVTKLPPVGNRPGDVEKWITKSLQDLQLDYVDLYLIHVPFSFVDAGDDYAPKDEEGKMKLDPTTDHVKVWAEMEKQVECGRTRAIGLSNFNTRQIERIQKSAKIKISMLQVELHLYFQQDKLAQFCKKEGIPITAYSPLGSRGLVKMINKIDEIPNILENDVVMEIAKTYKKTPAQIVLRYILQSGFATIPKSTNPQRLKENIQLFNWELKPEDVEKLKSLDQGESGRICDFTFFTGCDEHPEYPFKPRYPGLPPINLNYNSDL